MPDAGLPRGSFQVVPRRKRINPLEAIVLDNPSVGNYEELGDLYLDDGKFAKARECFDKVLARNRSIDPFYRPALAEMALNDFTAASADLEQVLARDPKYDYLRAAGPQAHMLALTNQRERADSLFAETLKVSTASETQYNYASFLAAEGRPQGSSRMGRADSPEKGDDARLHPAA